MARAKLLVLIKTLLLLLSYCQVVQKREESNQMPKHVKFVTSKPFEKHLREM